MADERILIVDDEESMREWLEIALNKEGYKAKTARSGREALKLIEGENFDCAIVDIRMPKMSGLEVLNRVKEENPWMSVIMITAFSSLDSAVEALRGGASDYITKPFKIEQIRHRLEKIFEGERLRRENIYLRRELELEEREIKGESKEIKEVLNLVAKIAGTDSTVMVYGESGTGKELVAREIHRLSHRVANPFVTINCAAVPETLLETELFGHKKGSFTGAIQDKEGLFKVADRGTFFLDEIAETSPAIQVKLLRVLQEREIVPVGETKPIRVDVRVIASTNEDLEKAVEEKKFREDLFYRLNVIPIKIPPVRERTGDIPILVNHFVELCCKRMGIPPKTVAKETMEALVKYDWPGNVRELENAVERAVILQEGRVIRPAVLSKKVFRKAVKRRPGTLEDREKEAILEALEETGGNKTQAAQHLGIHLSTLYRKLKGFGIDY